MSGPVGIPIIKKSMNMSIVYKLLKSAATYYEGCKFTYDEETNEIFFHGPEDMHKPILEEVLEMFKK